MPGCQRSRSLALRGPALALGERLERRRARARPPSARFGRASSRMARCSAADERPSQAAVRAGLELAGAPAAADGRAAHGVEQHGLAHAAQAGEHQAALGAAAGDALEHDVERRQLAVAAGQLGRALPGAGGVRVAHRVHDRTVSACLALIRYIRRKPHRRVPRPKWTHLLKKVGSNGADGATFLRRCVVGRGVLQDAAQTTRGAPSSDAMGLPAAAHACMPPATLTDSTPCALSHCAARPDRLPLRQMM